MKQKLRIAVNTRLLLPDKMEGLGRFADECLKRITRDHPEHEFIFIFDRKPSEQFLYHSNVTPVVAHPQARHPLLWYLFFEWGIPPVLRRHKADIFLSPDGWLSLRTPVPSLAVIHDLNFFHNPEWIDRFPLWYYNRYFPKFIRRANRIATVSEFSRNDICERFGVPSERIDIVYNGAKEDIRSLTEEDRKQVRDACSQGKPFFVFIGLIHPRKNLARMIRAYEKFRSASDKHHKFLVIGSNKYWSEETRRTWENSPYRDDIMLLGRLPDAETYRILAASEALLYTSLFEGFGIPILEAFRSRVPVITSNVTAMPEVGGEAALYADPLSVDSITDAMLQLTADAGLRDRLIQNSEIQLKKFTWENTARDLWNALEKLVQEA